jgi:hypothetical protein
LGRGSGNKSGSLATPAFNCLQNYLDFLPVFFVWQDAASLGVKEASLFIRRLLRRAALFLWITPFSAALSMALIAFKTASFVSGRLRFKAGASLVDSSTSGTAHTAVVQTALLVLTVSFDL